MARYAAAAVVLFTAGLAVRLSTGPSADMVRGEPGDSEIRVEASSSRGHLDFDWSDVEDAYQYRVVVWDPAEAVVVTEESVDRSSLSAGDDITSRLEAGLQPGKTYQFRVDAIDAENRLIRSSSAVDFRLNR